MQRTYLFDYEIHGSVMSWPVCVFISRNSKSKIWTLYFQYTDPEAGQYVMEKVKEPAYFTGVLEEHGCDIDVFCDALSESDNPELVWLASEIGR